MTEKKDKYKGNGESQSQVRSIINQIHDESESKERRREVVIRADGTKAVRVVKRRRTLVTESEKSRKSRRRFVYGVLTVFVFFILVGAFIMWRMSLMADESFIKEQEQKLAQAWGASSVSCNGVEISGADFTADSIIVEFGPESQIERVELNGLSATLSLQSFFQQRIVGSNLDIARADIRMRADAKTLSIPEWKLDSEIWRFSRYSCGDFSLSFGADVDNSPIALTKAELNMYRSPRNMAAHTLSISGGTFSMRGWHPVTLRTCKAQVASTGLENIRLEGALTENMLMEEVAPKVLISGRIPVGKPLSSELDFDGYFVDFCDLTDGRFTQLFRARTQPASRGAKAYAAFIQLPFDSDKPLFSGHFRLGNVHLSGFPALLVITDHMQPELRKKYLAPDFPAALVHVSHKDGDICMTVDKGNLASNDFMSIRGEIVMHADNTVSGKVDYGIPSRIVRIEYTDGEPDPIFNVESDDYAWFCTSLSGFSGSPTDNSDELDKLAEAKRAQRPARIPFDELDVDALSSRFSGESSSGSSSSSSSEGEKHEPEVEENFGETIDFNTDTTFGSGDGLMLQ